MRAGRTAATLHSFLADSIVGDKQACIPQLRCHICGRTEKPSKADLVQYLSRGWPECHGQTMGLSLVVAAMGEGK